MATPETEFGEGLKKARVMMVGEIPGDREDRLGHVFVGPAGRELDKALAAVGIDRTFKLGEARGRPVESDLAELVTATAHPSSILRAPSDEDRVAARAAFTRDLRAVAEFLAT